MRSIEVLRAVNTKKFVGILNRKSNQTGLEFKLVREFGSCYHNGYRIHVDVYSNSEKVGEITDHKCELELKIAASKITDKRADIISLYHRGDLSIRSKIELSIYRRFFDRLTF